MITAKDARNASMKNELLAKYNHSWLFRWRVRSIEKLIMKNAKFTDRAFYHPNFFLESLLFFNFKDLDYFEYDIFKMLKSNFEERGFESSITLFGVSSALYVSWRDLKMNFVSSEE